MSTHPNALIPIATFSRGKRYAWSPTCCAIFATHPPDTLFLSIGRDAAHYWDAVRFVADLAADGPAQWRLDYAQLVKSARADAEESQAQFAARIGIAVATIQKWEQGIRQPTGLHRETLMRALGLNPITPGLI